MWLLNLAVTYFLYVLWYTWITKGTPVIQHKLIIAFYAPQYPYRDMDGSKVVIHLIHITINTLNAQYHSCRPHATAGPLYSDNSNMSRYSEKEKGDAKWRMLVISTPDNYIENKQDRMKITRFLVDVYFNICLPLKCSTTVNLFLHLRRGQCIWWIWRPWHADRCC